MIGRRAFLSLMGLAAPGLIIDPERLLWVPGRKTMFVLHPTVITLIAPEVVIIPDWLIKEVAQSFHNVLKFYTVVEDHDGWRPVPGLEVGDRVRFLGVRG